MRERAWEQMLGWIVSATADLSGSPQSTRPSSHTHPGLRKTTPVFCSRLQCSLGLRRLLLRADAASVLHLWLESQTSCPGRRPTRHGRRGPGETSHPRPAWATQGFPGRDLVQALCLTAADPGLSSPSCTSVASVSGQFKPSLEVGKNTFNPIFQDHTLQSQLLRLPAAGLLVEAVLVGFPKPAGL